MQLVAPAGSMSALIAAVKAGADAVYLGMHAFGARAKARNFDRSSLPSAIRYAHLFDTKVFITLNTLIKDSELSDALDCAKFVFDCGADAAIVQDIRFIKLLKKELPELTLHASTQMGIHNADGARAVLDMGISRAVLSRETLPSDIFAIKNTGIEIEFFVQGALCISFSGNCYFSSLASSYSGNRGKCMQLCRKKYTLGNKTGYFLSAKDICLYKELDTLRSLGVDAIKIEGRMRSDEYVYRAVSVYKSAMSGEDAVRALKEVFNRGDFCSAYLDEDAPFRVIYPKSQANIGVSVGKIDNVNNKTVSVRGFAPHINDGFKIMRNGEEIGGASANNGRIVCDCHAKPGDELRRTFDGRISDELKGAERTIDADIKVDVLAGERPCAELRADGVNVKFIGECASQTALTKALSAADIEKCFNKVGDLPISPKVRVSTDGAFLPISALNEFRRGAYGALENELCGRLPKHKPQKPFSLEFNKFEGNGVILCVDDPSVVCDEITKRIDYLAVRPRDYSATVGFKPKAPILLELPVTMRGDDAKILRNAVDCDFVCGVISNNYYTLSFTDKPILLGYGHNIIGEFDAPHITSFESECETDGFTYVFGYAPLMTLCHCPYSKCKNCSGEDCLVDEADRRFVLRRYKAAHCYWQLLNCYPIDLTNVSRNRNLYYDCTGMDRDQIIKVLCGEFDGKSTRGNTNKGLK